MTPALVGQRNGLRWRQPLFLRLHQNKAPARHVDLFDKNDKEPKIERTYFDKNCKNTFQMMHSIAFVHTLTTDTQTTSHMAGGWAV